MQSTKMLTPPVSEPLTWAEICERYPDQRLCLVEVDLVHPNGPAIRSARVLGHGKTLDEAIDQAWPWREHYEMITLDGTGPVRIRYPRPRLILDDETRDAIFGPRR
jgi:hypothetical protein